MKERGLVVVDISELAKRWQIPVERVKYFIADCGMNPAQPEKWGVEHWEILMQEKQKAFDDSLFPEKLRPEPLSR
jgi:hypothetical protein